jgi:ferritin
MKMSEELQKAFNDQMGAEFQSAHYYLQMAAYFDATHMMGMSKWMRLQADEERLHAMRFYDYMLQRGCVVQMQAIPAPKANYDSVHEVFEQALEHERSVSRKIRDLYHLATAERDYPSYSLLQWFMDEQVEEESSIEHIVARLALIGSDAPALLMLDADLGARSAAASANPA